MTRRRPPAALAIAGALALLGAPAVHAQQAVVLSADATALEVGQAFLAHHAGDCLAILPQHVVAEAGRPALRREGRAGLLGETRTSADLGEDVAVARIDGGIATDCGSGALSVRSEIGRLLQQGRLASLRSINGDGTVAQLAVTIVDDDGAGLLRVQPTHPDNPIRKGLSGSLLMIDGVAAGMLLSVHARSGIGTVMRMDALMAQVDAHLLAAPPAVAAQAGGAARPPAPRARVVAWSSLPHSEAERAANLVAGDEAPAWRSVVAQWPVSIDLQLGEKPVVLDRLRLEARGVADPAELPAQVELFINVSGEARAWRALTAATLRFHDGRAEIAFAPVRARLLRLSFSGTAGGGHVISLGRVRLGKD